MKDGLRNAEPMGAGHGPVVAVVTGGNIDARVLARLLASRYGDGEGAR